MGLAGEETHEIGRDGVSRAKSWLEKTGRVDVQFTVYEVSGAQFLKFPNCSGGSFSFDLGGVLRLDTGNVNFYGEVKKVSSEANQAQKYREYLAKCYRAAIHSAMPHHFMWITWHPFAQTSWTRLCTADEVSAAVSTHQATYCGADDVDHQICKELAERLWLIVLSDRQETLSMSDAMLGHVKAAIVMGTVAP